MNFFVLFVFLFLGGGGCGGVQDVTNSHFIFYFEFSCLNQVSAIPLLLLLKIPYNLVLVEDAAIN